MKKLYKIMISVAIVFSIAAAPSVAENAPTAFTEPTTKMEFVAIPGGTFIMGNNGDEYAFPEHEVTVQPFLLGRYEVTFEQYEIFCRETGCTVPDDQGWGRGKQPAINVTWFEAVEFTEWLSRKTGKTFRLPTEAEWEFAALGGATTSFPWGEEIGSNKANCWGCGSEWDDKRTAPVGSFAPNGYGLYDVVGNVYEWCQDTFHKNYQGAPADGSAWILGGKSKKRINRGGAYDAPVSEMMIYRRCWDVNERRRAAHGFRVLLEQ